MKDLSQITFKTRYRSSEHNLLKDLYIPALSCAESYHRSVGYFTSRSIAEAAQGLAALIEAGGRLKLIASPVLTDEGCSVGLPPLNPRAESKCCCILCL